MIKVQDTQHLTPYTSLLYLSSSTLYRVIWSLGSHLLVAAVELFHPLGEVGEQGPDNSRGHLGHADAEVPL